MAIFCITAYSSGGDIFTFPLRSKTEKIIPQWVYNQVAVFGIDMAAYGIEARLFSYLFSPKITYTAIKIGKSTQSKPFTEQSQ